MEDGQTDDPADESEVVQMLRINTGMWIDLQGVIIVGRVFEKAVKGIEHLVRKKEEELSVEKLAKPYVSKRGRIIP